MKLICFPTGSLGEEIPIINGNISVVLENLEVNLLVLRGDEVTRHVQYSLPNSPILRPPCRTCDPTYTQFPISNQYLIPNHSKIYVVNPNSMLRPSEVDIKNCDPVKLYSVDSNVIWVQCAFENGQFEVVELHRRDNVTWLRHDSQNIDIRASHNVSRGGLVLVKEKDGENVTFLYYGRGSRLARKGLKEFSSVQYSKTSSLCESIEELFYINNELILIQCVLKDVPTDRGLVLFNTSNPSQSLTLFHRWRDSMKVHVFEGYVVLLSHDTVIIQHALRYKGIEQLIVFPPELSTSGIFVKLKNTINFVCTDMNNIYLIDIASVLDGNITAYQRIESKEEICTDETCSPIQYTEPLLFVPMKANELAMYTLDPVELHATAKILSNRYRYLFTYTMPEISVPTNITTTGNGTIVLESKPDDPKSSSPSSGVIVGITIAAFVVILSVVVVVSVWYYHKKRNSSQLVNYAIGFTYNMVQLSTVTFEKLF